MKKQREIKTVEKKLVLERSKIRDLTSTQLEEVAGGCRPGSGGCWSFSLTSQ